VAKPMICSFSRPPPKTTIRRAATMFSTARSTSASFRRSMTPANSSRVAWYGLLMRSLLDAGQWPAWPRRLPGFRLSLHYRPSAHARQPSASNEPELKVPDHFGTTLNPRNPTPKQHNTSTHSPISARPRSKTTDQVVLGRLHVKLRA
jgi:hypothetical protein